MTAEVHTLNITKTGVPLGPPHLHVFCMVGLLQWGTPPKQIYGLTVKRVADKPLESAETFVGVWKHFRG